MTREEKLISMLQPKEYESKIKLYCNMCQFNIKKFAQLENNKYLRRIKIENL